MLSQIQDIFKTSIDTKVKSLEILPHQIEQAANLIINCLVAGNKILSCGNGGSAGDAQHIASELLNRFNIERPNLPAIALTADALTVTAIANDYSYDEVFSRQLKALGQKDDVLFAVTTSGNSKNIIEAVKVAQDRDLKIVALTGKEGGNLRNFLRETDIELCVPSDTTARIQEVHLLIIHTICELIDLSLFS